MEAIQTLQELIGIDKLVSNETQHEKIGVINDILYEIVVNQLIDEEEVEDLVKDLIELDEFPEYPILTTADFIEEQELRDFISNHRDLNRKLLKITNEILPGNENIGKRVLMQIVLEQIALYVHSYGVIVDQDLTELFLVDILDAFRDSRLEE